MSATEDGAYITLSERRRTLLEKYLQKRVGYTKKQLMKILADELSDIRDAGDFSLRTLNFDLKYLTNCGAEIQKEKRKAKNKAGRLITEYYYRYANEKFSFQKQDLDPETLASINVAAAILKHIPGIDLHNDLKDVYQKLISYSDEAPEDRPYIMFDLRDGSVGLEHLPLILDAIRLKGVVSFDYQTFTSETLQNINVHPYLLKEYKSRWYLIGMNHEDKQIQHYGLDRIKSKKIKWENKITFEIDDTFNPVEYFKYIIGVRIVKGAMPERVILRYFGTRAKYVETTPLHSSQHLEAETLNSKTYSYQLIPNYELKSWILGYGAEIEVLEPKSLRDNINDLLLKGSNRYL